MMMNSRRWLPLAFLGTLLTLALAAPPAGAVSRHPPGVNVNAHGATTVFLTFGDLRKQVPAEAFWCGELIPASPDIGEKCRPDTVYGRLPLRYDLSQQTSPTTFTDIMSIPPNVTRRAYEAAKAGAASPFFYVRRFVSLTGGPDEYVTVTCRLTGGGAQTPLALTEVKIRFEGESPVTQVPSGKAPPRFFADIAYNGTGRLRGRWEVVVPGDDPPSPQDLLPEGSLAPEQRPNQKRYTQVGTFNEFLPPTGKTRLAGPDPARLPAKVEGLYQVLLRVEASDDKEGDSSRVEAGSGPGIVHSGGLAGFPLPTLRYYVGSGSDVASELGGGDRPVQIFPRDAAKVAEGEPVTLVWTPVRAAAFYRLEVRAAGGAAPAATAAGTGAGAKVLLSALVPAGMESYKTPPWFKERVGTGRLEWRVVALDGEGDEKATSGWRGLVYGSEPAAPAAK